jgi:hypothetical protein
MSKVTIIGMKELDQVFKGLPDILSHKIIQEEYTKAARPLVQAEKLSAPEGPTGRLIDSIGILKSSMSKATEIGEIKVGPRRGRRLGGNIAHLVEYGTTNRTLKGKGKYRAGTNRGVMPAKPFVGPSFNKTKDVVISGFNERIGKRLSVFIRSTLK